MAEVGEGKKLYQEKTKSGTSLAVQWLRLQTSTAGSAGSMPGQGTKIPHVLNCGQKWKKKKKKNQQEERGTRNKGGGKMLSVNLAFSKVLLAWGRKPQVFTLLN